MVWFEELFVGGELRGSGPAGFRFNVCDSVEGGTSYDACGRLRERKAGLAAGVIGARNQRNVDVRSRHNLDHNIWQPIVALESIIRREMLSKRKNSSHVAH